MRLMKGAVLVAALLTLLTLAVFATPIVSYPLAHYQYEMLVREQPQTRPEVESILFLVSRKRILSRDSLWGSSYALEPGQIFYSYLVLGREPIDVVYEADGAVVRIFSSYE